MALGLLVHPFGSGRSRASCYLLQVCESLCGDCCTRTPRFVLLYREASSFPPRSLRAVGGVVGECRWGRLPTVGCTLVRPANVVGPFFVCRGAVWWCCGCVLVECLFGAGRLPPWADLYNAFGNHPISGQVGTGNDTSVRNRGSDM